MTTIDRRRRTGATRVLASLALAATVLFLLPGVSALPQVSSAQVVTPQVTVAGDTTENGNVGSPGTELEFAL